MKLESPKLNSESEVDLTLLVCTYNRCADLRELLETAVSQQMHGKFSYEILVVDNNSNDATRDVVESFIARGHDNVRYLFEPKQGKSNALNTGLSAIRGWCYAITDDDFLLPNNWAYEILEGFRNHPQVAFVSGKVIPEWESEVPAWLTKKHWAAIAMSDYGDDEFYVDSNNQVCLLACSFRLSEVREVGDYHSELGPTLAAGGAIEDLELLQRLWSAGKKGVYLPHLSFRHKATADRLTKEYHRRWHTSHGRNYAIMRHHDVEKSASRLFDVPVYLYREAMKDGFSWLRYSLQGNRDEAFWHETHLRFFIGFFQQRRRDRSQSGAQRLSQEILGLFGLLARRTTQ
jgi:glycosyltransferase involved in cell wall biosynthesis